MELTKSPDRLALYCLCSDVRACGLSLVANPLETCGIPRSKYCSLDTVNYGPTVSRVSSFFKYKDFFENNGKIWSDARIKHELFYEYPNQPMPQVDEKSLV